MYRIAGFLSFVLFLFTGILKSQDLYLVSIENGFLADQNNFEFDVFIKSNSAPFELTSYQCALTFHPKINNGGTLNFTYIGGSSELSNPPSTGTGIYEDSLVSKLTFASMPGSDIINSSKKKIGRFRLQNSNSFGPYLTNIISLNWNFNGTVATILTGSQFTNITDSENHSSVIESFEKVIIESGVSSDTANLQNHPGKTLDAKGYFDDDELSYWKAEPVPQHIIYDLGDTRTVNLTRFSFYNFNFGREYVYSIHLSTDNQSWNAVVSFDTSSNIEYTENKFEPANARYVKLILHSSNQNQESSLWEAEIWGDNEAILPVELRNFSLSVKDGNVLLKWETATEVNNFGFEIQRSQNKTVWDVIGFVNGNGNSNIPHRYQFTDKEKLFAGTYYYRLKQIDTDGVFEYSPVLEIEINNIIEGYYLSQNYPNPFNPETNIRFSLPEDGKVKLAVFNILGEQVAEIVNREFEKGEHKIEFDGSDLSSGVYIYRLDVENRFSDIRKMILMK